MKNGYLILLVGIIFFICQASTPCLDPLPEKFQNRENHIENQMSVVDLDFHDLESSELHNVIGFNEKGWGSAYSSKITQNIIKNKDLLQQGMIAVCVGYLQNSYLNKKTTFRISENIILKYDNNELRLLPEKGTLSVIADRFSNYSAIDFLAYIDIREFKKIANSQNLILQMTVNDQISSYELKVPVLTEENEKLFEEDLKSAAYEQETPGKLLYAK